MRFSRDSWQVDSAIAKRKPLPDWYEDEPGLYPGDEFYLQAFWDLSTCRQIGMSPGPIPWTAIIEYARVKGLDDDVVEPFSTIIRKLDAVFLDDAEKEMERKTRQGSQSPGAPTKTR